MQTQQRVANGQRAGDAKSVSDALASIGLDMGDVRVGAADKVAAHLGVTVDPSVSPEELAEIIETSGGWA